MSNYIEFNDKVAFHPGYYIKELIDTRGFCKEIRYYSKELKYFDKRGTEAIN